MLREPNGKTRFSGFFLICSDPMQWSLLFDLSLGDAPSHDAQEGEANFPQAKLYKLNMTVIWWQSG
jgi:hypothetical protein